MKKLNFYFVGICGISMYSLAIYIKKLGFNVFGSDINFQCDQYIKLIAEGITVFREHNKNNIIKNNIDIVVYSNAVEHNNEVKFARKNKIKTISRAELLGMIIAKYENSICIAGVHGKSTTSAMLFNILTENKSMPNLHLGAFDINNNSYYITDSNYFVVESCEYKDSFLNFFPKIAVILNIEKEHLDYFKNKHNIITSFGRYANNADVLICNNKYVQKINRYLKNEHIITFGGNTGDYIAKNVKQSKKGITFSCYKKINEKYELFDDYNLQVYGKHNAINSLACIAVADYYNIDKSVIKQGLYNFKGIKRRFEIYDSSIPIIHDYAHHPTEIKETINMAEKLFGKKLLIVFEPHTYSRTRLLFDDFINVFESKNLLLLKTYSAREKYDYLGSAKYLAKNLNGSKYLSNYDDARVYIQHYINKGYGALILGAGTIDRLAKMLINATK